MHPTIPEEIWEFPRENVQVLELIGEGCFGQVFRAEAVEPSGSVAVVAVKTLKGTCPLLLVKAENVAIIHSLEIKLLQK